MCQYCGCRQVPLIRDYIDEHERVVDLGDATLRALAHDDRATAGRLVGQMSDLLGDHWRGEEDGVFTVMSQVDPTYAEYVDTLVLPA